MQLKKSRLLFTSLLIGLFLTLASSVASITAQAQDVIVIDDFEDNDTSDWGNFGGDNAGGGFGPAGDRPQEGNFYLSTGWGAGGPSGGFFGGMFKNFAEADQPALPADPWFNVYVLNQSDANSDGFTLEITIREDLDGNGWDGFGSAEESFRLDTTYTSADYNDQWTLLSAPLSAFNLVDGSGDGAFTGALDEIVLVIAGVPNADAGTTVEVDFDYIVFSDGGPIEDPNPGPAVEVIDDFEDNDTTDWGNFGGDNAGGGFGPAGDRPQEGNFYLSTGWGAGGPSGGFFGGMFKNFAEADQPTLPADPWFNVYVLNQSDANSEGFTLEITIREDLDGNGWDGIGSAEESFRLDTAYTSADYNDQWTLLSAPLSAFNLVDGSGDGAFTGALDEIVLVIAGVPNADAGTTVEVDFDYIVFSDGGPIEDPNPGPAVDIIDDFEDNDTTDWGNFGGDNAGGGFGPAGDRPQEGNFYLSTGWGAGGPSGGFFGGMFKNFAEADQPTLPADPWFNMYVLNQSDANSEGFTLEITIREDLDGNGWDGIGSAEESFRLDTAYTSADYNDQWTLLSAPLSAFNLVDGSGDGAFTGALDEIVLVIAGVPNADAGTTVEVDFDYIVFSDGGPIEDPNPGPGDGDVIQDFESGVAPGEPCPPNTPVIGFCTFNGAGSSVSLSTATTPPAPVLPAVGEPNSVLQMDIDSTAFAGFIEGFEAGGEVAPQDWSTREGISVYMFGQGTGSQLFIDILDNRNPGSTTDDAERYTVAFADDFTGWQLLEFPFNSFVRKEVGNGAPVDGLTLFEMHGYAFGALDTGGPQTYYFDNVQLYGEAAPPAASMQFTIQNTFVEEGTTGQVGVRLNRALGPDDPDEVSIDYATERSYATPGEEYTPTSGTLTFVKGGATELFFDVETFDDTKFEGDEQIVIRLTNPVGAERGALFQGSVLIDDNDSFDEKLLDDFVFEEFLWESDASVSLDTVKIEAGSADAYAGQDQYENVLEIETGLDITADLAQIIAEIEALLPTGQSAADNNLNAAIDALNAALARETVNKETFKDFEKAANKLNNAVKKSSSLKGPVESILNDLEALARSIAQAQLDIAIENKGKASEISWAIGYMAWGDSDALFGRTKSRSAIRNYRRAWERANKALKGIDVAVEFGREFPLGQDWTGTETIDFWFNGTGSGEEVTFVLKDNRAPDPGKDNWGLVWADEFDDPAGTAPNPDNWGFEIGDTTPDGKNGWGNEEFQYYTDDPANAAMDGDGNLVITLSEADGSQECYYGPCEYESARLITQNRAEFAYGRIESRLLVPNGGDGLWPAFWSLGTDITYNPWPGAGEIDFMEYVSRIPGEIFGTIHGPGYSGGGSFGGTFNEFGSVPFETPVYNDYHTFVVEWEPEKITWYVDGIKYHEASPADVSPNPWVFEKPFFLLLNFAIGGNFGGAIDPANLYPQEYKIDYIRVYQGPDSAERFETTFVDGAAGWQMISIPVTDFVRSAEQPEGAPNDGLGLTDVWGYSLQVPYGAGQTYQIDQVRRVPVPPPTNIIVTNTNDSGEGSLRDAIARIADNGTIEFDGTIAGQTITLTSGQLTIERSMTIAGTGVTLSGGNSSRVIQVNAGANVTINDVTISDGVGAPQGGGILNNGNLTLNGVTVSNNTQSAAGPASFDLGGGGIYNGTNAVLTLNNSTVTGNSSTNQPAGGIYSFFGSVTNINNSTISNNFAGDVAGGLRTLGNANIVNSTFSGNVGTVFAGGAVFHTDGQMNITNSTFTDNTAPNGAGLLVGAFGATAADITVVNTIVAGNNGPACGFEGGGPKTITSAGSNIASDDSCPFTEAGDQLSTDALLGPLADNGGPTQTHALQAGSPAIDAGDSGSCPTTDQRGVARDAACDIGAYEFVP